MTGPRPGAVTRAVGALKSWLVARPRNLGYAVVLAALALTVPFGGLAAAPEEELPVTPAGEAVTVAPWEITLERAGWGPDLGGAFSGVMGQTHVLVEGTLRTTGDRTLSTGELRGSVVVLTEGLGDAFGTPLVDGALPVLTAYELEPTPQSLRAVAPGLTYALGLHLTSLDGTVPDQLELELRTKTYRQSSLDDSMIWTDPVATTRVVVPTQRSGPVFANVWELAP